MRVRTTKVLPWLGVHRCVRPHFGVSSLFHRCDVMTLRPVDSKIFFSLFYARYALIDISNFRVNQTEPVTCTQVVDIVGDHAPSALIG